MSDSEKPKGKPPMLKLYSHPKMAIGQKFGKEDFKNFKDIAVIWANDFGGDANPLVPKITFKEFAQIWNDALEGKVALKIKGLSQAVKALEEAGAVESDEVKSDEDVPF